MPTFSPRTFLAVALGVTLLGAIAPEAGPGTIPAQVDGFDNARTPWQFAFPRDHAAHPGFAIEWWYFTGHLRTEDGRRFGYELTFFREKTRQGQLYPADLALTDESGRIFTYEEQVAGEGAGQGHASTQTLDVAVKDWTLTGSAPFVLHANGSAIGLDLQQFSDKPPAVHGSDGVFVKADCASCASHYYSMTRLRTTGTLRYEGATLHVEGTSWMDHEFGSEELSPDQAGWDWFSIQLDDRREIMDYRLRRRDGTLSPETSGTLVDAGAGVHHLSRDDVTADATGQWKSPHTNAIYPHGWHVRVPSAQLDLVLIPVIDDQELVAQGGGTTYWEGAVEVQDATTRAHLGVGYVELTGYTEPLRL